MAIHEANKAIAMGKTKDSANLSVVISADTPRQFSSKDFETEVNDSKEGILIYLYIVCPAELLNILNQYICGKIGKKHFHKKV